MSWGIFYGMLFLSSVMLTGYLRLYALKIQCLDIPNERSSHVAPTPRGGGLAFVVCFILSMWFIGYAIALPSALISSLSLIGVGISSVGWLDDRYGLSAQIRLIAQCLLAIGSLYLLGVFETTYWLGGLGVIYVVWMINLFNFMDGLDGYAAMESIFIAGILGGGSLLLIPPGLSLLLGALAVSVFGFGVWNFPKANIFMGDVGSAFLGGILAVISIFIGTSRPEFMWSWMILIGLFMCDGTLTLLFRVVRGERFWEAHRQHAYQQLAQHLNSHVLVTLSGLLLNVCWLLPLAWLSDSGHWPGWICLVLAYVPLSVGGCLNQKSVRSVSIGLGKPS